MALHTITVSVFCNNLLFQIGGVVALSNYAAHEDMTRAPRWTRDEFMLEPPLCSSRWERKLWTTALSSLQSSTTSGNCLIGSIHAHSQEHVSANKDYQAWR